MGVLQSDQKARCRTYKQLDQAHPIGETWRPNPRLPIRCGQVVAFQSPLLGRGRHGFVAALAFREPNIFGMYPADAASSDEIVAQHRWLARPQVRVHNCKPSVWSSEPCVLVQAKIGCAGGSRLK